MEKLILNDINYYFKTQPKISIEAEREINDDTIVGELSLIINLDWENEIGVEYLINSNELYVTHQNVYLSVSDTTEDICRQLLKHWVKTIDFPEKWYITGE